ncbi:hypothetical protein [Nocardiopsis sp. JB363]|uniref:hypothetical protein n=1 Tax=Nocardiopsis sp. JB363 TaxID=1434837 RepID=UPI00097A318A|nr:hypothetical protein [Nocardiopsis sp. JB363]SIO85026.1 Alpha-1,2-mannosidase [Nocardiopsis sp. JB363]
MEPTYADLTASPARVANAHVDRENARFGGSRIELDSGGSVDLTFYLDRAIVEGVLRVTALVSKSGGSPGYAPLTVLVNGEPVASRLTIPGGGDLPQSLDFAVPGGWLRTDGPNVVTVRSGTDSRTMLWLYRISLDSIDERDRSVRAMLAAADQRSVLRYTTRKRVQSAEGSEQRWEPGGRLLVYVDRGEMAPIAQLSWRDTDGAEAAISFQSALGDFHGYHRSADGLLSEYRGDLEERWAYPEGTEETTVHRFGTEEHWGERWHTSGELRLMVEDRGAPVERITWRDQRENSGSVTFEEKAAGFLGYYQRVNEGPIGYRGRAVNER